MTSLIFKRLDIKTFGYPMFSGGIQKNGMKWISIVLLSWLILNALRYQSNTGKGSLKNNSLKVWGLS